MLKVLDLGGHWVLSEAKGPGGWPATVPGCVHHDLLRAGVIDDPYAGEEELRCQWVGERDWVYRREFEADDDLLACREILLRCEGLDTLATVRINGKIIGEADNMFRAWEWSAKEALRPGPNRIEITFRSTLPLLGEREKSLHLRSARCKPWEPEGRSWIRKEQCNYGWDWGPVLITAGIYKNISIIGITRARLADVHLHQEHRRGQVALSVDVSAHVLGENAGLQVRATIERDGETVAETVSPLRGRKAQLEALIRKPQLWWPNGFGEQPLYRVRVTLEDAAGQPIDRWERRIGLRRIRLVRERDRWGESFFFEVNGQPVFAKGANWIPADAIKARITRETYRSLLDAARQAHMNMIRVWGGGYYESDDFYDLCDELGLMVWQDFMFACATYPAHLSGFMANVKAEAHDQVARLRHHACLALWCGNNELEGWIAQPKRGRGFPDMPWKHYTRLFDRLLPEVVAERDPDTAYWPSSPHTPVPRKRNECSHPDSGDAHLWAVWHGRKPFEWYRTSFHRFCSEFGFQSFPAPATVASFARGPERNLTHPVMEHHQRSGTGNSVIVDYMLSWFRFPKGTEWALWLSQIQQALSIQYAVEHWRRNRPRCMGALYWQLNDNWPVASWASIDYFGRWKALHYAARRFFAPVLLSALERPEERHFELHLSNDTANPVTGEIRWSLTRCDGETVLEGKAAARVKAFSSRCALAIDAAEPVEKFGPRDLILWAEFDRGEGEPSRAWSALVKPKEMELGDPGLSWKTRALAKRRFAVDLSSTGPCLFAFADLGPIEARWSDLFFPLRAGEHRTLTCDVAEDLTARQFEGALKFHGLTDCYL